MTRTPWTQSAPTRRQVLAAGLGAAAATALPLSRAWGQDASPAPARPAGKPNVLFIAVDDLRPQLGCYGHRQMRSPHIDRLAEGGALFERAYCQQAVCAPSRASFLTGCRPDTTRVHDLDTPLETVRPDLVTIPEHFRANGYHTTWVGKIYHHPKRDDPTGWAEAPPELAGRGGWMGYATEEAIKVLEQRRANARNDNARRTAKGPPTEAGELPDDAYLDAKHATHAIEKMRSFKDNPDAPFFMAVGFHKPHLPFACPKRYWDLYDREKIDLADNPFRPEGAPDFAMTNWGELRQYAGIPRNPDPLTEQQARELVHGYYACVSFTDAQVGRLMSALDELGLRENTVVVLWGDHGWHLGDHGLWCKHTNFENAVRAPLLFSGSGVKPGTRSAALTEFVDVYPTLCDLAELEKPQQLEGTSVTPLLADPKRPWKKAAFSQYPRGRNVMGYSLRTDRYRFTRWGPREGATQPVEVQLELYDHQTDPHENKNLAGDPAHAGAVKELTTLLDAGWRGALPAA